MALGALAIALTGSGCGTSRPRGPMTDGERMYLAKCTSCHAAYEPAERTPREWQKQVQKMEDLGKVKLSPEERTLILGFLGGPPAAPQPLPSSSAKPAADSSPAQPAPSTSR